MKRWIAILGPQQVVLISNTHASNTENYFKTKRRQDGVGIGTLLFELLKARLATVHVHVHVVLISIL